MGGAHAPGHAPPPPSEYPANPHTAFLIDVAGEDESATNDIGQEGFLSNPARDSTALTIVEIDLSTLSDDLIQAPRYLVRHRKLWTGTRHTGVGAGLASYLEKSFPHKLIPFLFNSATKSKLGWDFLAVIETGRFKDHTTPECHSERSEESPSPLSPDPSPLFWKQISSCQMEITPGPNRSMKWEVPDGTCDESTNFDAPDSLSSLGEVY